MLSSVRSPRIPVRSELWIGSRLRAAGARAGALAVLVTATALPCTAAGHDAAPPQRIGALPTCEAPIDAAIGSAEPGADFVTATSTGVRSLPYPRLANIFLLGAVEESMIPQLARWDLVVLSPVWTDAQLARLRALNPDIKLFVYVCPYAVERAPYAPNTLATDLQRYASDNDLWWYNTRRTPASDWPNTSMVNPTDAAPAGAQGAWRAWLVKRLVQHLETHPQLDGVFLDNLWRSISWAQPWLQLDSDCNPKRSPGGCDGVADAPAVLDQRWNSAMTDLTARLRTETTRLGRRNGKSYALLANDASDYFTSLNGSMIENFPRGGGGDPGNAFGYNWNRSMLQARVGYLEPQYAARPYPAGILNAGWGGTLQAPSRSADFERHKRFTLASALLGDGFYSLDASPSEHSALWWEPEYDSGGVGAGFLGESRGAAFRVLQPDGPELLTNGDFAAGPRQAWVFQSGGADATLDADATQFAQAPPSARLVVRRSTGPLCTKLWMAPVRLAAGQAYTLRFWARTDVPQEILVHLYAETCPSFRCLSDVRLRIDKTWKRYEYSFVSTGDADAGLNFFAGTVGTLWLDDVSLQAGDTGLYRRNFEHGIVLLNYTNQVQRVRLDASYRHLLVPGNALYDGALVSEEVLGPSDARILLRIPASQRKAEVPAMLAHDELRGAWPNPFNPGTRIAFELARPAHVRLQLVDVSGKRVRTLLDAFRPAGAQSADWDGRDERGVRVASGVYFCSLEATGTRSTLKLVRID